MGTTEQEMIQGNGFSKECRTVIDLGESTVDGTGSLYQENQNPVLGYNMKKVRQTILEHESIFRHQLEELHRLYGRQKELMNDFKRRETHVKEEKTRSPFSLCPEDGKRTWNAPHSSPFRSMVGRMSTLQGHPIQDGRILSNSEPWFSSNGNVLRQAEVFSSNTSGTWNRSQASYEGDTKLSLGAGQTPQCSTGGATFDLYRRNNLVGDMRLANIRANFSSTGNITAKDFLQNAQEGMSRGSRPSIPGFGNGKSIKEHLSEDYPVHCPEKGRFDQSLPVRDKVLMNDLSKAVSQRKSKLFGIEIHTDPLQAASAISTTLGAKVEPSSWIARSLAENIDLGETDGDGNKDGKGESLAKRSFSHHSDTNVDQLRAYSLENAPKSHTLLPWFLRKSKDCGNLSKGATNPYFMNLDSLQNCSQNFFRKTETADGTFETSSQKKEILEPPAEGRINHVVGTEKIIGFPMVHMLDLNCADDYSEVESYGSGKVDVNKNDQFGNENLVLRKGLNGFISDLRNRIDLNSSLDEEVQPPAPSLSTTLQKIASKEIDLEAPAALDSEMDTFPEGRVTKPESTHDECDKAAAEALLEISSYEVRNLSIAGAGDAPREDTDNSCLKWFVEIISMECRGDLEVPSGVDNESIPDGVDYFEYMTLKLEDSKDEYRCCEPVVLKNLNDNETGKEVLPKRPQRGQSRRGRRLKDFQRDILPGLVTLSRLEVTEDFQAFEELTKDEGSNSSRQLGLQRCLTRNGRGRKRLGGEMTAQQPICQLEDISLGRWGKRTRRLPRQRCANAFLSFPVKC